MPKYFLSDGIICSPYCQQLAIPFLEYFIEGILPNDHEEAYLLKRLVTRYFVEGGILFRKRFNGEPLRCLGTFEAQSVMQEVHAGECGDPQGKRRLLQ